MRARLRFEILKRDSFTCRYCGAKPSDSVTLHVDHVIPRAAGGTDAPENLVTACHGCNLGKSDKPLSCAVSASPEAAAKMLETVENMNKAALMATEHAEAVERAEEARASVSAVVDIEWDKRFTFELPEHVYRTLPYWIGAIGPQRVIDAVAATARSTASSRTGICRYFIACLRNMRDESKNATPALALELDQK